MLRLGASVHALLMTESSSAHKFKGVMMEFCRSVKWHGGVETSDRSF